MHRMENTSLAELCLVAACAPWTDAGRLVDARTGLVRPGREGEAEDNARHRAAVLTRIKSTLPLPGESPPGCLARTHIALFMSQLGRGARSHTRFSEHAIAGAAPVMTPANIARVCLHACNVWPFRAVVNTRYRPTSPTTMQALCWSPCCMRLVSLYLMNVTSRGIDCHVLDSVR